MSGGENQQNHRDQAGCSVALLALFRYGCGYSISTPSPPDRDENWMALNHQGMSRDIPRLSMRLGENCEKKDHLLHIGDDDILCLFIGRNSYSYSFLG